MVTYGPDAVRSADGSTADCTESVVNLRRYPFSEPAGPAWRDVVSGARNDLRRRGCCVLREFIDAAAWNVLRTQSRRVAPRAYYDVETVNAYNAAVDASLARGHPARIGLRRGNAFVARDNIPEDFVIHRLFRSELFQRFVADCFGLPKVYPLADPLAGLVINVVKPGMEHPWHFDTNEFSVSLLTQKADAGGVFEFCPNIRSAECENFDDVAAVLDGRGRHFVRCLSLRVGDLQLFKGRFALHRVTGVEGRTERHTAIFSFSERDGVIGSVARTQQLFGRLLPEHVVAAGRAVRGDVLLD